MKKVYFFAAMALFVFGCTNKNPKNNEIVNDTVLSDKVPVQEEQVVEPTQLVNLDANDLAFFELKGPVKEMTSKYGIKYDFDQNGNLVSVNGHDPFAKPTEEFLNDMEENCNFEDYVFFSRDDNGLIHEAFYYEDYETCYWENGRVARIEGDCEGDLYTIRFEYDDKAELDRTITERAESPGEEYKIGYWVTRRDHHGNWIQRYVREEEDDNLETRTILYYDENEQYPNDLLFFDLKGPVKSMTDDEKTYKFNENGILVLIDNRDPFEPQTQEELEKIIEQGRYNDYYHYVRDENGLISKISYYEGYNGFNWENGRIVKNEGGGEGLDWKTTYEYDENGDVIGSTYTEYEYYSDDPTFESVSTYTIQKRDQYGNWIEREVKNQTDNRVEKRTITYYE